MKRIIKIAFCLIIVALALFLTESVVFAEGADAPVYTVSGSDGSYSLISGGASIAEGDSLSQLLDSIPGGGEYELYFDKVSTSLGITLYGGNITLTGVLTFLGDASLTVDGGNVKISGAGHGLAFPVGKEIYIGALRDFEKEWNA